MRSYRVAAIAVMSALAAGFAVTLPPTSSPAIADPGHPGVPDDPVEVFWEDFENGVGTTPIGLEAYTGAPPNEATYTADDAWLTACNGSIVAFDAPDDALGDTTCSQQGYFDNLRQLAYALGVHSDPDDLEPPGASGNHAVTAYTENNPGVGSIQFETVEPLQLPAATGRYLTFSVDSSAVNCGVSAPQYQFFLMDGGTEVAVGGPINACASQSSYAVPAVGTLGARNVPAGTFTSMGSILFTGAQFGIRMTNANGSGIGNDAAFDNIRVLDATPQLDKSFESAWVPPGGTSALTFTVTNTSELAAKAGWSFTDTLPAGLTVAEPAATTTCSNATVDAVAGSDAIAVTGDLAAGVTSCTVTVTVAAAAAGSYTNGPDEVTVTGLNPPADTTLDVFENAWECSALGFLFQSPDGDDGAHPVHGIDLATGEPALLGETAVNVNAVGYNPLDDYVYGWDVENGAIVRIGADFAVDPVSDPPEIVNTMLAGDFDADGHLWLSLPTGAQPWFEVDLAPGSPTYGDVIASGTADVSLALDWAFLGDALYGAAAGGVLLEFDPQTGEATHLGPIAGLPSDGFYGAAYADADGYLYLSHNDTGGIYRVDVDAVAATLISQGPVSSANDGARCADAPIPTLTVSKRVDGRSLPADQFVVGIEQDGETLTSASTTGEAITASTEDWPVSQGSVYTITDAMADGSPNSLAAYEASVECTDLTAGEAVPVSGSGPWTVSIDEPRAYHCEITNRALVSDLTVVKSASPSDDSSYQAGQEITYSFVVTNTGETVLSEIAIDETAFSGTNPLPTPVCAATTLEPGEQTVCSTTYELSQLDIDAGSVTNSATATGTPPGGVPPTSPPSEVTIPQPQLPELTVVKTADREVITQAGQTVNYAFEVTNTGNVTVEDVSIDEVAFSGAGELSPVQCPADTVLLPGEVVTCTAEYVVVPADLVDTGALSNVAVALGTAPDGAPVESDPSTAEVEIDGPALAVTGSDPVPLAAALVALLALGSALVIGGMRKSRSDRG